MMIRATVIEAANYGALADQSEFSACSRFQDLLPARLIRAYRLTTQCSKSSVSGAISVQVSYVPLWNIPFGLVRPVQIKSESRSELLIGD